MRDRLTGIGVKAILHSEGSLITRLTVRIEPLDPLSERLLSISLEGEYFGFDIMDDFASLPSGTRDFILLFKTYTFNVSDRQASEITINTPLDTLFFRELLAAGCVFTLDGDKFPLKAETGYKPLGIGFDETFENLRLDGMKGFSLLETTFENYVTDRKKLFPVLFMLNREIMRELFISGSVKAEYSLKKKLLQGSEENSFLEGRFNLPEVREATDEKIVFRYTHNPQGEFKLGAFLTLGEGGASEREIPLSFDELRKSALLQEDILFPAGKNSLIIARAGTPFYEKIKKINESLRSSFFELLNEYNDNEITTSDSEALFRKFLPSVLPEAELWGPSGKMEFLDGGFDSKSADIHEGSDWLEVNFNYKIEDIVLTLTELSSIAKKGYIEKDGAIIVPKAEEIDSLRSLFDELDGSMDGKGLLKSPYEIAYLFKEGIELNIDPSLSGVKEFSDYSGHEQKVLRKIAIPDPPNGVLRPYQKTGVYWMAFLNRTGFSGILADEMGLGKTVQVLSFFLSISGQKGGTSIIICPSALLYNWVNEIRKFMGGGLTYMVIDGPKKDRVEKIAVMDSYDVIITSYPLLHADSLDYSSKSFYYCVLDEAQHIKNKKAKRTLSIKSIKAKYRIAMTGTPIENSISEFWSIFDFLMPGFLGNHSHFKKKFLDPISGINQVERLDALKSLNSLVKPFMLRRTKSAVQKELPEKIEQELYLELTEKQKALYIETLAGVRNNYGKLKGAGALERKAIDILAALTRLRQICLHPALLMPDLGEVEDISIKLKALMELIYESIDSGHRIVVFSQFVEMLKIIRLELKKEEIEYSYLDGQTKNRFALVEHFNASDIPVFLISLKAGGTGLNIVGADSVVIFDPWWNPAVESQAVDRVHRMGQTRTVNVYRLLTMGTIEEKIRKLQFHKKEVFDSIVTPSNSYISRMTWDDLRDLLDI
jgi:SNF2 family DNA or RNA helicase